MAERADAFIALPGGWGTLEEIFEVTTWTQLRVPPKSRSGMLNAHGYYDALITFLDHAAVEGFIRPAFRNLLEVHTDIDELLDALATKELPPADPRLIKQQ